MSSTQNLDWIRQIAREMASLDEKPQFGTPVAFDQERFQNELRALLNRPELTLSVEVKGWLAPNQVMDGFEDGRVEMAIDWVPLDYPAYFVTDEATLKELMSILFVSEKEGGHFYDSTLVEGFSTYFGAEVLRLLSEQQFGAPLKPRLGPKIGELQRRLGEESCFAVDVCLNFGTQPLWGRILLSESFRAAWKTYFTRQGFQPVNEEMSRKLMVDLGLEVGRTKLRYDEWKNVKGGDFILLDHCTYDPSEKSGAVVLTLMQKPILRARLKEGGIKITNYPVYEEVSESMVEKPKKSPEDDIYGDLEDEDEFDLEHEELPTFQEDQEEKSAPEEETQERRPISAEDIPLDLIVEVGRVRMSAASLMQLGPGNLLELHVAPEQGVDLIVNGKKVGKGELIRMGDVLGVRILSL